MYRLINDNSFDIIFAVSEEVIARARLMGYRDYGVCCRVFVSEAPNSVPLVQLFNPRLLEHVLVTSDAQRASTEQLGFVFDADLGYCSAPDSPQPPGAVPLHQLWHPAIRRHYYTVRDEERDSVRVNGYQVEGVVCFVQQPP